ncbi:MAG: exo-alpha-sialidase [Opitutus sp.]|nr:exo-alpha-sialidase [Opitutus sp.]
MFALAGILAGGEATGQTVAGRPAVRKVRDLVIYQDANFYSAFPSVVRRPDGELMVAFRRAPSRVALGEAKEGHVDPNSQLVQVRSRDSGATWTREPALIHAHALGGSQDPCLLQLRDGALLCASYGWAFVQPAAVAKMKPPVFEVKAGVVFLGGYLVRSADGGHTWAGPVFPPHVSSEIYFDPHGRPLPAYNRGALCEGQDGRIFWVIAATDVASPRKTSNHLLVSDDHGATWSYSAPVAVDAKVTFNEASVYETPRKDLVAFLRTAALDDHAVLARSTDGGKSFLPWQDLGFQGHPLHALRLPDQRVLLTYGYRHPPFGVRARILNAECTDFATAPEIVLRDDGGTTDVGYPWSVAVDGQRVLVVYYFNVAGGPRQIAGTMIEID